MKFGFVMDFTAEFCMVASNIEILHFKTIFYDIGANNIIKADFSTNDKDYERLYI